MTWLKTIIFCLLLVAQGLSAQVDQVDQVEAGQPVLETDVSLVSSEISADLLAAEKGAVDTKAEQEKDKFHIPWEKLGPGKIQDLIKKLSQKKDGSNKTAHSWLSSWSLAYLYNHLMKLAVGMHDNTVGDPYSLNEGTKEKLGSSQLILMTEYVKILSDPEYMAGLNADPGSEVRAAYEQRMQKFMLNDITKLFSPQESADILLYELSKLPFFPKNPKDYAAFKKMAVKFGAFPVGAIVLGEKLANDKLRGKIYLPVFMLPSGYLGLILSAKIDHVGLSLSPRISGQGELILMRFRLKAQVEEDRGPMFTEDGRNLNMELSEDWSGLLVKKYGIKSHFYFKARRQMDLKAKENLDFMEAGLNVSSEKEGKLFNLFSYTNYHANFGFDSDQNLKSTFQINRIKEHFMFSLDLSGQYNFKSQDYTASGRTHLQLVLNDQLNVGAGMQFDKNKNGGVMTGFVGVTEESRNLSARLQMILKDNGLGSPGVDQSRGGMTWNVGVGIAGQLEDQKKADRKHLSFVDFRVRGQMKIYQDYERQLEKNFQEMTNDKALWSENSTGQLEFNQKYQYLIVPLLYSLSSVGGEIESKFREYPSLREHYKRKYKENPFAGEILDPEVSQSIEQLILRHQELEKKGSENLKSELIFLSLAHYFQAL